MINYILIAYQNGLNDKNYNGNTVEEINKLKKMFGNLNMCPMSCGSSCLRINDTIGKPYLLKKKEENSLSPDEISEINSFFNNRNKRIEIYEMTPLRFTGKKPR